MRNAKDRIREATNQHGQLEPRLKQPKRGRPQTTTTSPLGKLILRAMRLLELSYQDIACESRKLAMRRGNADMCIGKSTLGNIISGTIRQPGGAKLDSLRSILHLSRADIDTALGLQPEQRLAEQLEMNRARTYELSPDEITRQRTVRVPILHRDTDLNKTQFLDGLIEHWANVEVEYLSGCYPPNLVYVVIGEQDRFASPVAPPRTRVLVDMFLTEVPATESLSYHERALFYVLTPHGFTCSYLENTAGGKIVLVPHPLSGQIREELLLSQVRVIGQVVGLLFPK